ncbi:M64 family metallopeptidase [Phaeacidiphilus oryzae]|uniref:M64 family metallopeptidase n=1 Tax=Phaeacidiphilus oryzae TaxID=348818 RepID=UPI000690CE7C|nr:M64 family metallopeptidase [Phaeacidiphilus oryzae]
MRRTLGSAAVALVLGLLLGCLVPASAGGAERAGNRISLVFVGDGYTRSELPLYRRQVRAVWAALSSIEPFHRYRRLFRIRRIDVVSPRPGLRSGSPLGMRFGCEGMARLLCADTDAVDRYADTVPGPRYVIALANSRIYGGEGGDDGITTLSAGGPQALQVVQHEFGHTLGGLGDEYDTAPAEDDYPNVSTANAGQMRREHVKWWRWLGAADPSGGRVGAYRSGNGLYRPTRDSVMRDLGHPYNLPSREAIIERLYRQVSPVDAAWPAEGTVTGRPLLRVRPAVPDARVVWRVDGRWAGTGDLLPTGRLPRGGTVTATVRDTTPWVRDEGFRARYMTRTLRWTLAG